MVITNRNTTPSSNAAMFQILFYLPIYFQSIHGQSAIRSGVNSLPFLGFFAFGAMLSGGLVGKTRLLQPYQLASALVMTAGMALFYTLEVDSSQARYIGPQVLLGFGLGLGSQVPMTAVQGFSKSEDVAPATGIMLSKSSSIRHYNVSCNCANSFTNFRNSVSSHQRRLFHCSGAMSFRKPHAAGTRDHCSQPRRYASSKYWRIHGPTRLHR